MRRLFSLTLVCMIALCMVSVGCDSKDATQITPPAEDVKDDTEVEMESEDYEKAMNEMK